ncbi:hypothetical protein [Arcobacter sp. FWKO B]|uniref:hypothetical protein n=1 Tax=Arcobacter sp. FWKO B TaxID=2593672 RepID=UPI0018A4367C|nr:hypothetical protein [Arcobacter sp. FWKO B]QOG12129.1 hypothetical protein FWKOB_05190 [Arcobacter sp. FWKO B]
MEDLIIPFIMVVAIVIYLIVGRAKFEKNLKEQLSKDYEIYKSTLIQTKNEDTKELVGLVFEKEGQIFIECIKDSAKSKLESGKYKLKDFSC